ncbi:hypothetical protein C0J52_24182 [Blattella germanica]|nr:hypothetical protein C0J52_24182 [Blattella germanica]
MLLSVLGSDCDYSELSVDEIESEECVSSSDSSSSASSSDERTKGKPLQSDGREIVLNVHKFFSEEFEALKNGRPTISVSDIMGRTATATGVSRSTIYRRDGLLDELTDKFIINVEDSDTESDVSDDETDGNHEQDMAADASSEHLDGIFPLPPSP